MGTQEIFSLLKIQYLLSILSSHDCIQHPISQRDLIPCMISQGIALRLVEKGKNRYLLYLGELEPREVNLEQKKLILKLLGKENTKLEEEKCSIS